ncbi:MAG: amidohydrolase family protein [Chitinophagales bacterium]|nr:amidohydrolase family protein [Chitinophagales bacterium]
MSYLKFKANHIFTGTKMLPEHFVLITNSKGKIENIIEEKDAGENIQQLQGIITPGFINTHCHTELSHLKNTIQEKTGLVDFVLNIVNNRNANEENILQAIQNAEEEMLQNGIVAVGDICNTAFSLQQKKQNKIAYYNFIEVSGWLPQIAEKKNSEAVALAQKFSKLQQPCVIVPHAPYSVSENLWSLINQQFHHHTITIHNQETKAENDLFLNGTGSFISMYKQMNIAHNSFKPSTQNSLPSYFHQLCNAQNILLVHNTFTSITDIQFLQQQHFFSQTQIYFCLCPNANLYIENVLPNIELLRANHVQLTLGTDSLASNHSLNIVDEIKTILKHYPQIAITEVLQWATLNGAKALAMDNNLGSFEKGKTPGVVVLSNNYNAVKRLI